jgi:NAD(P)-dependent dehydrogenase (short-subunit alcohol dehydrogenase family)
VDALEDRRRSVMASNATGDRGVLAGDVVVVTGGNRGIGLGMAQALAASGATVIVWGRNEELNAAAVESLGADGGHSAVACDVTVETQVRAAIEASLDLRGRLDAFVANAGTAGTNTRFVDLTLAEWRQVQAVNMEGAFLCLREAAGAMIRQGDGGALVGVGSLSAIMASGRQQHYGASKAGLVALMRGLAVEMAPYRIRSNSLLPGWVATPMTLTRQSDDRLNRLVTARTPVSRWGSPADIGPAAVFLANRRHLFHTGDSVVVDGGFHVA